MRTVNEEDQLVCESEISVAVVGKGGEFVLIRLDENGDGDEALITEAAMKGYAYCGVFGAKNGEVGAKCQPYPDAAYTMLRAAHAFARIVVAHAFAQQAARLTPKDDSARWLTRLTALPDPGD